MQKIFGLVLDEFGNRRPNVSVQVTYPGSSSLAPLWSVNDSGTSQLANPLTTDANGEYSFYPLNGRYDRMIYGGGISTKDIEDVLAFDPVDATLPNVNSMDGFDVIGGVGSGDLLWFQGSDFVPTTVEASLGNRFARVGSATPDWVHLHAVQEGGSAVLSLTQQKSGYLQAWHVGSGSAGLGTLNSYLYVDDGNLHMATNSGDFMVDGSLVVSGDLTVHGTTVTLNTETLQVEDNIIVLNKNIAGTPTLNAGLEVERGTSPNVYPILWDESIDRSRWGDAAGALHTIPGLDVADTWTAEQKFTNGISLGDTVLREYNAEADITALVSGSAFGTLIEGDISGQVVVGIRGNDVHDGFHIIDTNNGSNVDYARNLFSVTGGGADVKGLPLMNPLDPTSGTHVGDRDFNDGRYIQPTQLLAGDNMTLTTSANGTVTFSTSGGGGGVTDHGALTGLADDDHTQYARVDGTRAFTGDVNVSGTGINLDSATGTITCDALTITSGQFIFNGSPFGLQHNNGDVAFRSTENGASDLYYNGAIKLSTTSIGAHVSGDISWNASDRRLKSEFNDFDSGALVDAIRVGSFRYDPDKCEAAGFMDYDNREHYGFDALNLYEVGGDKLSAVAPFDSDGKGNSKSEKNYRTPRDRELLAVLYREVKALRARVKELENV